MISLNQKSYLLAILKNKFYSENSERIWDVVSILTDKEYKYCLALSYNGMDKELYKFYIEKTKKLCQ